MGVNQTKLIYIWFYLTYTYMYMQIANEKYFFFFLVWNSKLPPKKRRGNPGGGHALVCLVCIESPRSMNTKGGGPLQKHTQTSGGQNFRGVLSQVASTSNHTPSLSLSLCLCPSWPAGQRQHQRQLCVCTLQSSSKTNFTTVVRYW